MTGVVQVQIVDRGCNAADHREVCTARFGIIRLRAFVVRGFRPGARRVGAFVAHPAAPARRGPPFRRNLVVGVDPRVGGDDQLCFVAGVVEMPSRVAGDGDLLDLVAALVAVAGQHPLLGVGDS